MLRPHHHDASAIFPRLVEGQFCRFHKALTEKKAQKLVKFVNRR